MTEVKKFSREPPLRYRAEKRRDRAYIDFLYIILKHTQQATSWYKNYLHRRKGKKVMTATNIFYNFVGFRYSPPLNVLLLTNPLSRFAFDIDR